VPKASGVPPARSGNAHERVVVLIGRRLAAARYIRVMQSQAGNVVAEGKHNMDEAHARLIDWMIVCANLPSVSSF